MTGPSSRRGFLSGLVSLPLIGGGVTLIGRPVAAAEPVTPALLDSYDAWLLYERCRLKAEKVGSAFYWKGMPGGDEVLDVALGFIPIANAGFKFHHGRTPSDLPSTRAALVLSAAGVDWREGRR